ncbi:MAG: hypothetical protein ABJF11_11785 [Reichenbachiella sp.]|uniref:hypothetical protein n=1 Tax=Reichenbachiella sp. TaxID=2184521 RepID=UPI0032645BB6
MMRRTLTLLLFLISHQIIAQDYTVIHVIGKIYDSSTKSYLKPGAKLAENAQLKFESANARAAALSASRGRYIIQRQAAQSTSGDLVYTLASVLAPARGKMSTRAGGINNQMDFMKKFGEGPVALISGRYEVAVSPTSYPTNDVKFFYASYSFNDELINKKLEVQNDKLIFDASSFYSIDGIAVDPAMTSNTKLFYYDSDSQESTEIAPLNFSIVGATEIKSINSSLGDIDSEERIASLVDIFNSLYGKCEESQVRAALKNMD